MRMSAVFFACKSAEVTRYCGKKDMFIKYAIATVTAIGFTHEFEYPPKAYFVSKREHKVIKKIATGGYVPGSSIPINTPCIAAGMIKLLCDFMLLIYIASADREATNAAMITSRDE